MHGNDPGTLLPLCIGDGLANLTYLSDNILAGNKVLYKGHAVAAVAARDPHTAEEAIKRIRVEYEELRPVTNVHEAMEEAAPILLDSLRTVSLGQLGDKPTNIATHFQLARGDVEQGFREADIILEREFQTATVHKGYIEPHSATAFWDADGQLTVWCSTQGSFPAATSLLRYCSIPCPR